MRYDISNMTVREKVLQTVVLQGDNKKLFGEEKSLADEKIGALFFFGEIITEAADTGLDVARKRLKTYIDKSDIPLLVTSDFENGCGGMLKGLTELPFLMSLGSANDEELAYNYGKATALEAKSVGANWSFSPVSDLNMNKRNPLINMRSVGDNAENASKILKSLVKGMQDNGLAACAKHFPGDGIDWRDQHITTTSNLLEFEEWKRTSGKVFQELIDAGVYSIMAGHISLPSYQKERTKEGLCLPATLSHELITDLLKGEMGFDGVVVTDALNMGGFGGWYKDRIQSEVEAFKAGCDMVLWPHDGYVDALVKAIKSGEVSEDRLNDAVLRIMKMKEKLGLFDKDNHPIELTAADEQFTSKVQKQVAEKSLTLLRNNKNLIPIKAETVKKIAVVPITNHEPCFEDAKFMCNELEKRGFIVEFCKDGINDSQIDANDVVVYALFSRPFRPIGFLDFYGPEAWKVAHSLEYGEEKSIFVSFGSPYFVNQYFQRAGTFVNAYSPVQASVGAFVRALCGEIEFKSFSPVNLQR